MDEIRKIGHLIKNIDNLCLVALFLRNINNPVFGSGTSARRVKKSFTLDAMICTSFVNN